MERVGITLFFVLLCIILCFKQAYAHESCCMKKLKEKQQLQQEEFIVDPNDNGPPPDFDHHGNKRYIVDPNSVKPDFWDDDDDGPWEPDIIINPLYELKRRLIRNPNYISPRQILASKLRNEINEAVPWVTLGVILTAILGLIPLPLEKLMTQLSSPEKVNKGKSWQVTSLIKSALLGLITPLCSCGALPIASGFVTTYAVPISSAISFLTASQSAGLDSAIITFGLLGFEAAVSRLLGAIILSVAVGLSISSFSPKHNQKPSKEKEVESSKTTSGPGVNGKITIQKFVTSIIDTSWDIYPTVLLGLTLSVLMVHFLPFLLHPYDSLQQEKGENQKYNETVFSIVRPFLVRVVVLMSALPIQVCEHTTVTLAAGIRKAGGSSGLAYAFLLSAPATNLPSLLLLLKVAATATKISTTGQSNNSSSTAYSNYSVVLRVALSLVGTALLLSYAVDAAGIDMLIDKEADAGNSVSTNHDMMASLPKWYVAISPWIAGLLLTACAMRKMSSVVASVASNKSSKINNGYSCCSGTMSIPSNCATKNDTSNGKKNN